MSARERSIELLKRARRNAMPQVLRKPPKRPGAAGLPVMAPVGPGPKPLEGGAAVVIPKSDTVA